MWVMNSREDALLERVDNQAKSQGSPEALEYIEMLRLLIKSDFGDFEKDERGSWMFERLKTKNSFSHSKDPSTFHLNRILELKLFDKAHKKECFF